MHGKPTVARTSLKGLEPKRTYRLDFHENGKIGDMCQAAGKEFNPLAEVDENGHYNPYQDPSRGRLDLVTVDAKGQVTN